jgi:hypothetical protein
MQARSHAPSAGAMCWVVSVEGRQSQHGHGHCWAGPSSHRVHLLDVVLCWTETNTRNQVYDDDWTLASTPSYGEYQQLSVNTQPDAIAFAQAHFNER